MAPDEYHKASNLVTSDGSKRWLSSKKDRSGKTEIALQLEEPCQIAYLDIGSVWCASLEVRVGRSDWPQSMEFKPLMPTVMLMSLLDCRLNRGVTSTQMFSKKDFLQETSCELWDRLQIICRQPYRRDVQYGLSFIRIKNMNSVTSHGAQTASNKDLNKTDKVVLDTSSIQKHFFGEMSEKEEDSPSDRLKYRLMKMAGSSENGCEQEQALSRTAMLVLKASENNKSFNPRQKSSPLPKRGLFSERLAKRNDVPIEDEAKAFLPLLNVTAADIDKVTVADLRHKFEKRKRKKLTKEEKVVFSEICQDFFCDLVEKSAEILDTNDPDLGLGSVGLKTQQKLLETDYSSSSFSGEPASEKAETPSGRRSQFKQSAKIHSTVNKSLPAKVVSSCSPPSPASDFTNIRHRCSGASSDDVHLSKVPVGVNVHVGASDSLNTLNPSAVSSLCSCDRTFSDVVNQHINDKLQTADNITPRKQDRSLKASLDSVQTRQDSDRRKQTASNQENDSSDSSKNDAISVSSIPYNMENDRVVENNESETLFHNGPAQKIPVVDDVNKSFQTLHTPASRAQNRRSADVTSLYSVTPAKRKKLNRTSLDLLQEFNSEIVDGDTDMEAFDDINDSKADSLTDEGESSQSGSKSTIISPTKICHSKAAKGINSSAEFTPQNSIPKENEAVQSKRSSRSAKGKVYHMRTSPNNVEKACYTKSSENSCLQSVTSDSTTSSSHSLDAQNCGHSGDHRLTDSTSNDTDVNSASSAGPVLNRNRRKKCKNSTDLHQSASVKKKDRDQGQIKSWTSVSSDLLNEGCDQRLGDRDQKFKKRGGNRSTKSSLISSETDTVFCEQCFSLYPVDDINIHKEFCAPQSNHHLGSAPTESHDLSHEFLIDEAVDYAECPICLQRYPQDVLPVHASECGI